MSAQVYARLVAGRVTWAGLPTRRLLFIADGVAAVVVCVVAVASIPDRPSAGLARLAVLIGGSTIAWRRLWPFAATIVALAAVLAGQWLVPQPLVDTEPFAILLDTYMAASLGFAAGRWRRVLLLGGVSLLGLLVFAGLAHTHDLGTIAQAALPATIAPTIAGGLVAWRRIVTQRLELTRMLLEDEQEMRIERAALDERNRLARELHDVVGHAVSVMVIQAGAARLMLADHDDAGARTRMERIAAAGRDALGDLHRLVAPEDRGVDPAFQRLSDLTTRASDAGLPTELIVEGDLSSLSEELTLGLYRVVQEALTNAVKYARGGRATVTVRARDGACELSVVNDRPRTALPVAWLDSGGRGIPGMRERVRHHGGELRVGPGADGTFEVLAMIPERFDPDVPTTAIPWVTHGLVERWRAVAPYRRYAFAAAVLVALELEVALSPHRQQPLLENVLVAAAMAIACLWRTSRPLATCVAITALAVPLSGGLSDITQPTVMSTFVFTVPLYSVAAWAPVRSAAVGLFVVLSMNAGVGTWHHVSATQFVDNLVLTVALWTVGRLIRSQRTLAAEYASASASLLAERAERQRAMALSERSRIVVDLEASVLRDVTTMVSVADSALDDPRVESVQSIETTGRDALNAMREILGMLRPEGSLTPEELQPA